MRKPRVNGRSLASALALTVSLVLWPACSGSNIPSVPTFSASGSGGGSAASGAPGQAGTAGSTLCTPGSACGGNPGPDLALNGGGQANGGGSNGSSSGAPALCQPPAFVAPGCVEARPDGTEALCNHLDDDCDGMVDEGCPCAIGDVQPCFLGPPARLGVGACVAGTQTCLRGGELSPFWGECEGGIGPSPERCDGLDNDCNGCADDLEGCKPQVTCPGPSDPRIPLGVPLTPYSLRGRDFFSDPVSSWSWSVEGGPCDALTPNSPSFTLTGANTETATLTPKLSGDYKITMTVTPLNGPTFTCSWIVHVKAPGLRVEMCYPESSTQDLDLYLKQPGHTTPWFTGPTQFSTALDQCSWANCEANLRGGSITPPPAQTVTRANWGYANSPLSLCQNTLQGAVWQALGYCSSPRLDIDNNLSEATGVPENINVDAPKDGEAFRIMVANFSGTLARPLVNVYCDGERVATIGAAPDAVANFAGTPGAAGIGALWRVADVTAHVSGNQTSCTVSVVHPKASSAGFDVTFDDPRY
ncbi:MAG TPA: MopE-related protein [Polyangiaceae bacterium]|nr:MopE-related protein [Polyangiaceae bacterium]